MACFATVHRQLLPQRFRSVPSLQWEHAGRECYHCGQLAYDANGNVTSVTTTVSRVKFAWDYLNRLISTGAGTSTSTYGYDAWGQRVKMTVATSTSATTTTFYPSKYYNISSGSATSVKHIFANGEEVATI
jgi:YD repeat-containing protein